MGEPLDASAYGGPGWIPRPTTLRQEIGSLWAACGASSEWAPLRAVLLHRPGPELDAVQDPDRWQMLERLDADRARAQHDTLASVYRGLGVQVYYVEPVTQPPANLLFTSDLFLMTPEGAVVGRPASAARAGEERFVAARLAALGIPILLTVRATGTFEGADAQWIDGTAVLLATGLRTNAEGAAQVARLLNDLGVETIAVGLPFGAMHLMGVLRIVDRDLAVAWPGRVPFAAVQALRQRGFTVLFPPATAQEEWRVGLNFVTLGPRRVLMAAGLPHIQRFLQEAGIACQSVAIDELAKAAGGIACMSGILEREEWRQ